jgi:hypothetical protein
MQIALVGTILTIGGPMLAIAQSSQAKSDRYTWNGELVSLEKAAKIMTVKSRVAYEDAISALKHFKAGERVWIVWSGIHDSSDAVRQVRRSETGTLWHKEGTASSERAVTQRSRADSAERLSMLL